MLISVNRTNPVEGILKRKDSKYTIGNIAYPNNIKIRNNRPKKYKLLNYNYTQAKP